MTKPADIRRYALSLLELSRKFLLADGDLDPVAFIITADEQLLRPLELRNETEKLTCCKKIAEARSRVAIAIVTVFLARSKDYGQENFSQETYSWGDLQDSDSERCILVTVSGPGIKNWAVALPFNSKGKKIVFQKIIEFADGVDLGLFPDWSDQVTNPRVS
ncbi:MAG TPA: hypothetical protein VFQ41_23485 [Candidatus Angelobacter sp.]|nr:hypothetical protein [Candidatus Angelobacter sp.]